MVIRYASEANAGAPGPSRLRPLAPTLAVEGVSEKVSGLARAGLARLWRRLPVMIFAAALPLAAAFAYLKVSSPVYHATASVFVDPAGGRPGRPDSPADPAIMAAHVRQATARSVFERAIEADRLAGDSSIHARPTGVAALVRIMLDLVNRPAEDRPTNRQETLLRVLAEQVSAQRSGEANLIEITARSSDATTAARLANAVAQAFVSEVVAGADSAQGAERARVAVRGDEALKKLREAEGKLTEFRARNGIEPARAGVQDGDAVSQLSRARAASLDTKTRSDQIQKLLASGKDIEAIADLVKSPAIDRLRIQYNEAAAQEASFRTSLGPRHPSYLEAAEQARERRRLLMEGLRLAASSARADWQAARDQELALEKRAGADAPALAAAPAPAEPPAMLRELERNVDLARIAYDRSLKTQQSAEAAPDQALARIVTRASAPSEPSLAVSASLWSRAALASAGLAALAFLLGTGRRRNRSLSVKPTRAWEAEPTAADSAPAPSVTAPLVKRPGKSKAAPASAAESWSQAAERAYGAAPAVMPDGRTMPQPAEPHMAPQTPSQSLAREFAARDSEFALQMVLVTAETPSARQSDVALDLARAAVELDLRVLVIDANPFEWDLSHRFAAAPSLGRLHLNGRDRPLLKVDLGGWVIAMVPNEQVRALPANDAEGLHRQSLAGHFDLVIMNGAPLTDAMTVRALARTAQSVVVALSSNVGPSAAQLAGQLGISASQIRILAGTPLPTQPPGANTRPMSVVRMPRCA